MMFMLIVKVLRKSMVRQELDSLHRPKPDSRPDFVISPIVLTWDLAVFAISGRRRAYAVVPRDDLESFRRMLRSGELDHVIGAYLDAPETGRVVPSYPGAVRAPRLYDHFESRTRLVTPERARNGMLELEDGTVLIRPAPPPPSAPGVWAAAADQSRLQRVRFR